MNDQQRTRLAAKAKRLTRELLEATTVLFTPDTILGWYRKLIAQKYDGSENCKNPGRPRISQEIICVASDGGSARRGVHSASDTSNLSLFH